MWDVFLVILVRAVDPHIQSLIVEERQALAPKFNALLLNNHLDGRFFRHIVFVHHESIVGPSVLTHEVFKQRQSFSDRAMCLCFSLNEIHFFNAHQRIGRMRANVHVRIISLVRTELQRSISGKRIVNFIRQMRLFVAAVFIFLEKIDADII